MSVVEFVPSFSLDDARRLADEHYALNGSVEALPSYQDQNFLIVGKSGKKYVLKIANGAEEFDVLDAQNQVMDHVSGEHEGLFPYVLESLQDKKIEEITSADGQVHFMRVVTYLHGTPMGKVKRHSPELMFDLGHKLGLLDKALQSFDHPALHREFHWDLANGLNIIKKNAQLIQDKAFRDLVITFGENFESRTEPRLSRLRKSMIYNDANEYNVLLGGGDDIFTRDQSVTGIIDLGDVMFGYTVGDLAIAIAYAMLNKTQPLEAAMEIVRGYHATFPLEDEELAVLFDLVAMRMCMSVCVGAEQIASQPDNEYLAVSQEPIRNTLPKWLDIHPRFAEAAFRHACGHVPFASSSGLVAALREKTSSYASILSRDLQTKPPLVFDLSIASPLLNGDPQENEEPKLTHRLQAQSTKADAAFGVGQYDEARYIYTSPAFKTGDGPTDETRTVHLGIDLFADAGTPIHAPLDGTVVAFNDNNAPQDYGPVIVLAHEMGEETFYTLYGHLSRESLSDLAIGQTIEKGTAFAEIGSADVNGGWTPHLHFQVMVDHLELGCDFPGVAAPSQREIWLSLCPDPNLILGLPDDLFPERAPTKAETLSTRRERLGGNLSVAYRSPVKIVRGWMQYLYDEQGRKYIDSYNNVAHVGHAHPKVVEAAREQIGILNTNTRYLHDNINCYAEKLTSLLPEGLDVCYFVNSASEANELALRLSRAYTQQKDLIVLEAAYHGNTTSLIDISPYKHDGPGGAGAPDWVHTVPIPDVFRGEYKVDDPQAGVKYAAYVKQVIEKIQAGGRGLAGFIAESLPSVGGQIVFPDGYAADVYRYVKNAGGVCIADEVQTGFGRVGSHLWGFEMQNVTPDIVVLGKPIGNGHPLAAVVTRREIADAFDNGMEYFATFGGNPVSCAVGLAVLDVLQEDGLQANALRVGNQLLDGLKSFVGKYDMVADARGAGLFLGVELVRDLSTLEPAATEASFIANRMREHGILLGTDGPYHNVVKIRPPMPFNESNAEYLLETFEKILKESF